MALAVLIVLAAGLAAPAAGHAYKLLGHRWAGNTVPYYNAAKAHGAAVRHAARLWNRSGARIRFVAVPRRRARLIVRYQRPICTGFAVVRLGIRKLARSTVLLPPVTRRTRRCSDRFNTTITAAHEFGHVLGLWHEPRRCALMNPSSFHLGSPQCGAIGRMNRTPWLWRCRVIEPDDVRGAVSIYGGRVRPRPKPFCSTYRAQPAPTLVSLTADGATGSIAARLRRPPDPRIPKLLLLSVLGSRTGVSIDFAKDRCPPPTSTLGQPWHVAPGRERRFYVADGLEPGRYCVAAQAVDRIGRPGGRVEEFITVPAPEPEPEPPPEEL
jgi:hypothetical protein